MKIVLSEFNNQYQTYSFGYCLYASPEHDHEIPEVYQKGFLPYSSDPDLKSSVFYLARSLRVDLAEFGDTSENRRVDRKMTSLDITFQVYSRDQFNLTPEIEQFCLNYADDRFAYKAMVPERLKYVLHHALGNSFMTFRIGDQLLGLVYGVTQGDMFHYWFSFYDTGFLDHGPIGKWMMWKVIHWAKAHGKRFVYLGTCYGESALYKVRDFKGLTFYDGMIWNPDLQNLKERCYQDAHLPAKDYLKVHHALDKAFLNL